MNTTQRKPGDEKMTRSLTPAMSKLWKKADALKVGRQYSECTRNPDKAVRDKFKRDRQIVGTKAWAICECLRLPNEVEMWSDERCKSVSAALDS